METKLKLPEGFIKKYTKLLNEEAPAFFATFDDPSYSGYRINTNKPGKLTTMEYLENKDRIDYCDTGFYGQIDGKTMDHVTGYLYSQEPSAMYVGEVVDAQPGERVLDLCAAPGGKSTHIINKMNNDGILVSNEIFGKRASILSENIERWGATHTVVTNESPDKLAPHFLQYFDRILVDAPCSGEGMFRKEPAGIQYWTEDYAAECANRQKKILASALEMLKPGGTLIYSTCTFAPEEDEQIAAWLLSEYGNLAMVPIKKYDGMDEGQPQWANDDPELSKAVRLFPHHLQGEGHFIAKFVLDADPAPEEIKVKAPKYNTMDKDETSLFNDFLTATGLRLPTGDLVKFGDNLFLLPIGLNSIAKVKFVRPGLQLGVFKKNRFEPAHSLALATHPDDIKAKIEITDEQWHHYIHGETITIEETKDKGWYLLVCQGHSISFSKLVGKTLKNFYPKGLRV